MHMIEVWAEELMLEKFANVGEIRDKHVHQENFIKYI